MNKLYLVIASSFLLASNEVPYFQNQLHAAVPHLKRSAPDSAPTPESVKKDAPVIESEEEPQDTKVPTTPSSHEPSSPENDG